MYLLLESFTIMDAMEIWTTAWASNVLLEAMKFWFYSILFSLTLSFLELFQLSYKSPTSKQSEKANGRPKKTSKASKAHELMAKRQDIVKRIITDGCDLLIPGFVTGWIETSFATVGISGVVSTVLVSTDIWNRVQRTA